MKYTSVHHFLEHVTARNPGQPEFIQAVKEYTGAGKVDVVYPSVSIVAENPVAVVERTVAKKGTGELAKAYLDFLYTPQGQEIAAKHNIRPRNEAVLKKHAATFKPIKLFPVQELFGHALSALLDLGRRDQPSAPRTRLSIRTLATLAIDGRASPRNPRVATWSMASSGSFEVACRSSASAISAGAMPQPSSATSIRPMPPAARATAIRVAPASMAFSTSSFNALAGLSTTSPAAMRLTTCSGRRRIDTLRPLYEALAAREAWLCRSRTFGGPRRPGHPIESLC